MKHIINVCIFLFITVTFSTSHAFEINSENKSQIKIDEILRMNNPVEEDKDRALEWLKLMGRGRLTLTVKSEEPITLNAELENITSFMNSDNKNCFGFTLKSTEKNIVSVLSCNSNVMICPGGIKNCNNESFTPTHKNSHGWERVGTITNSQYIIEISQNQFIYRILEKNCLIPSRHGCFLNGIGWHNYKTYHFSPSIPTI